MFDRVGFLVFLVQRFDAVIEALEKGQAIDLSGLPPSPGQGKEHWYNMFFYCSKQAGKLYLNFIYFKKKSYKVISRKNEREKGDTRDRREQGGIGVYTHNKKINKNKVC